MNKRTHGSLVSTAVLFFASWLVAAGATLADTELLLAHLSTNAIFPECGVQGSSACNYPLAIKVFRVGYLPDEDQPHPIFDVLPRPLFNSVMSDLSRASTECPGDDLASELTLAQNQSNLTEGKPFFSTAAARTSGCFGVVAFNSNPPEIELIWISGKIYGWTECRYSEYGGSCTMTLYPPMDEDVPPADRLAMRVNLISPKAIRPFVHNIGQVVKRLSTRSELFIKFQDLADLIANGPRFDY